jgi:dTDP-4-amino-4,6-dideoxygalactose transaminase
MPREKVFVTKPVLPKLQDLNSELEEIWKSGWITNMGQKHNAFESKLVDVLKVKNVSLFNNGTIALLIALKALDLPYGSEVITTPFTFAATAHCIAWNGLVPVFCDIEPDTMCIDAKKIEKHITPKTSAILGVHVYGFPCDVKSIDQIAKKHNLKVIYDAAHAFSTEIDGQGIGTYGDITMFSFHATKLFNSVEGGCLTYSNEALKHRIYNLRNFGIRSEELVEEVGINGKMNEIQAAIGLLNLGQFESEKHRRSFVKNYYNERLGAIKGIKLPKFTGNVTDSFQYYPILIEDSYSISRDKLHENFARENIVTRKYFYPLCSDYECYRNLESSSVENLSVANYMKGRVLCLPYYGDLSQETLNAICNVIDESRN